MTENTGTETAADTGEQTRYRKSDYSGEEFMILYIDWALYSKYYFSEEANGDAGERCDIRTHVDY